MPYTTINKSTDYFNTKLYTGNGSARSITGVGFQPDWLWIKQRSSTENHQVFDAVRTAGKQLETNTNSAESSTSLQSAFVSDGFSINDAAEVNGNGATYVSWNWKANGQGSANTDGTINSTYTSVNTTAGFSIVKYTGNGTAGATVGHGLGTAPKMIIAKKLSGTSGWQVGHETMGWDKGSYLNLTDAQASDGGAWNSTAPTSSVFSLGTSSYTNTSGQTYIAYCFADKTGYSKCGKMTGNGNADGTFVYCGFKPQFILMKQYTSVVQWYIYDAKRDGTNQGDGASGGNRSLRPNTTSAEEQASGYPMDILSNGFKFYTSSQEVNKSGNSNFYLAIGQSLVGTNNVPCTAR